MLRVTIILCSVLVCSAVWGYSTTNADQNPLIEESSAIVVGIIEEQLSVIRPDKIAGASKIRPDGRVMTELPNPSEYMVGSLYRFRVDEVIKKDRGVKKGYVISIFVPGRGTTTHSPAFVKGQRFLIFLSALKEDDKEYEGTSVVNVRNASAGGKRFNPRDIYGVVSGLRGAVPITTENRAIVNEIRAAVRATRR